MVFEADTGSFDGEAGVGGFYPVTLIHMEGVRAVVVGGGKVGQRKVEGLLKSGAQVRLISPEATPALQDLARSGQLEWLARPYRQGDLEEARLVFAATDRREVNTEVTAEARRLGLLCNVADRPEEGSFHVPAVHRQPGLIVAVSTAGQSPGRARQIRDKIAAWLTRSLV
jgi:cobalt-precorrin 5A hydrolase/precorrin-3B C17-methyltransferase